MTNEQDLSDEPPPYEPGDSGSIVCLQSGMYEIHRTSEHLLRRTMLTDTCSHPVYYTLKRSGIFSRKEIFCLGRDKEIDRVERSEHRKAFRVVMSYGEAEHVVMMKRTKFAFFPNYRFVLDGVTYEWRRLASLKRIAHLQVVSEGCDAQDDTFTSNPAIPSTSRHVAASKSIGIHGTMTTSLATKSVPLAVLTMGKGRAPRKKRLQVSEALCTSWQKNIELQHVVVATVLTLSLFRTKPRPIIGKPHSGKRPGAIGQLKM